MAQHGSIACIREHEACQEPVLRRDPPKLKAWETVGEPHLLVVGPYRMMVSIAPRGDGSHVVITIDYWGKSQRSSNTRVSAFVQHFG